MNAKVIDKEQTCLFFHQNCYDVPFRYGGVAHLISCDIEEGNSREIWAGIHLILRVSVQTPISKFLIIVAIAQFLLFR